MIEWYKSDNLIILFDKKPSVSIRYSTPESTKEQIESIKQYPFVNDKKLKVFIKDKEQGCSFIIPEGYLFDGMTIPRFAWTLIGVSKEDNRGLIAALIHDYICLHKHVIMNNRALSTNIFNALLEVGGMNKLRRFVMKNSVAMYQTLCCRWN